MARMFFIKMRILRLVLKIFDVSKYSTQTIPSEKLSSPLLPDHYRFIIQEILLNIKTEPVLTKSLDRGWLSTENIPILFASCFPSRRDMHRCKRFRFMDCNIVNQLGFTDTKMQLFEGLPTLFGLIDYPC